MGICITQSFLVLFVVFSHNPHLQALGGSAFHKRDLSLFAGEVFHFP